MKARLPHLLRLLAALLLGCAAATAHDQTDPSFLLTATSSDFAAYFPGELANGYLSTMTSPRGTEGNLAYMVAFMDYAKGDMARPAAIPGWTEIDYSTGKSAAGQFWLNQAGLDPAKFQDYRQTLNLHDATLTTSYRYVDGSKSTRMKVLTLVSQASPHLAATRVSITPDFDGVVQLSFALNLWAPHQPRLPLATLSGEQMQEAVAAHNLKLEPIPPATPDRAAIWYHGDTHVLAGNGNTRDLTLWLDGRAEQGLGMAEAAAIGLPQGMRPRDVKLYQSAYRLALNVSVAVRKGTTYTFSKYIAVSREGWGGDAKADVALATAARADGIDALLDAHRAAWAKLWKSDIRIDGDPRAQRAVHSDLYYLLSNVTPDTAWSVGACGITPDYAGHVFWDSDSWIFPALLLLHPERAKSLVMFRDRTLPAAQQRAHARGLQGAMYPWEADPQNGTEQTPHFAHVLGEREIHVNADIAIAQWQYYLATGDRAWLRRHGWPVIRDVARYWASRTTWNPRKQRYEILHVTSVEENYNDVPNDTFTNADAARALTIASAAAALAGDKADPRWADIAARMDLPFSAVGDHYLDMDESVPHDTGGSDLTLLSFPSLDLPMNGQVRRNDYALAVEPAKPSDRTPATMGVAPRAIAAATIGDTAETTRWIERNVAQDMFKPPFNVRPETAENNTGYFLTGSGGFLQSLIYGLTGLRLEQGGLLEAYPPMLPATWKSLTLKDISFRGKRYDITVDRDAAGKPRLQRKPL
ncbi:MAG: glycoside hydrolase family 65 protein [Rhodanobacter sp.]|nr:MAG: glycoside hydrolase family 65 protein [Rhodanobacter sp.]